MPAARITTRNGVNIAVACAVTDAISLLGLPVDDEPQSADGGCSASSGRVPASAVLWGLVGVALAIGRARRRA